MAKLNIKPGDVIEWIYTCDNELVVKDETLYSSIERNYVPIGSNLFHVCISIDDETYSWLNKNGLFRTRTDETTGGFGRAASTRVVPRVRK